MSFGRRVSRSSEQAWPRYGNTKLLEHENAWDKAFVASAQAAGHIFEQMFREHPNQSDVSQDDISLTCLEHNP
jgi:hypothetical protein